MKAIGLLVLACMQSGAPPRDDASGAAEPSPVAKRLTAAARTIEDADALYSYNPVGKRDPFRGKLVEGRRPCERCTPLQELDLSQLSLVGVVWGTDRARGLVMDPKGEGHVVELGTYVGKNWGRVTAITSDTVVITEETMGADQLVLHQTELHLPEVALL
jgi:type IV pilus assembly protein PilP